MSSSCKAIQEDCLALLMSFKDGNDLSFRGFCRKWEEHEFCYIFYGCRNVYEQINFTEALFSVVKGILIKAEKLSLQIGCLYLYYALYQKQPLQNFIKMRITPSDCEKLYELVILLKSRLSLTEAQMVFMKLWSQNAFKFAATDKEILSVKTNTRMTQLSSATTDKFEALNLRVEMEDIFDEEEGIVAGLELLEGAYNDMKMKLVDNDPNLAPSDTSSKIKFNLEKIASILNRTTKYLGDPKECDIQQPKTTARSRILDKISDIQKSKSTLEETPGPSRKKKKVVIYSKVEDGDEICYIPGERPAYEKKSYAEKNMQRK